MNLQDKAQQTVVKLLRDTVKGDLVWQRDTDVADVEFATNKVVDVVYRATFADTRLRLYYSKYQASLDGEHFYWESRLVLELVDEEGKSIWKFPESPRLKDLLRFVTLKAGDVEEQLDRILST